MTDFAATMFRLENRRGYSVPRLNIAYAEADTGFEWRLTCGGTRAYVVRIGVPLVRDLDAQAADSHFMVRRITTALLLAGAGLFHPEACGRILFKDVQGLVSWDCHLDQPDPMLEALDASYGARAYDWFTVLCRHTVLRRAADDAHLALSYPHEALVFVYRGLEWIKMGLGLKWEQLAADMGVPYSELRNLKKTANTEMGVRHATPDATKLRADPSNYGSWVCALLSALSAARARLDPSFVPMTVDQVVEVVKRSMPTIPYE